ncbi:hypothetical protein DAEQUDRAFT_695305 [Daedalea quercina L-15889]|uniref:P-loop containing nucleoside triphosphate hydrolase protein n=1 Tax=Daedalea quercina L-15889 TaxID=1314783 RepID=A0A165N7A5_9APHY|nr:hypothetical protein DAEQUDRAFT_695305 [Daedalea quercina L-15889]
MMPQDTVLSADSSYALHRKQFLALVKNLYASGAQADLDLPCIAVIGNQSADKSSLVEAISGITVPRDAGTCTRCPMECRLSSSSEPWRCQVSIRWEFDQQSKRCDKVREETFGGIITNKTDVELMLRRAQAAVLNPGVPMAKFLTMSVDSLDDAGAAQAKRLAFSRNVVCIDLAGPDLTDLSFVDLPGIIQVAEASIVQFVENLVLTHIKGNCLILVTCPMSDDIENQKALRLARDVDPSGLRTIGVLTKPDTLTVGAIKQQENWLDVLEGRNVQHRLTHGYFCTRQPDEAERRDGITAAQARAAEATFFAKTIPQPQHFGTPNLVKTLSARLTHIIDKAVPKLQQQVIDQLATCRSELDALPPVITEPASFILSLVTGYCAAVRAYAKGDPGALVQKNHVSYAAFKRAICATAPPFLPFPSAADAPAHALAYLGLDLDEHESESACDAVVWGVQTKCMYLCDVKEYIVQSRARELPNNIPYPAKVALIKDFQITWNSLCQAVFDDVTKHFQETLAQLMREEFQGYSLLHSRVNAAVQELLSDRRNVAWDHLKGLLEFESTPFTQNKRLLTEKTENNLARFKTARAGKDKDLFSDEIRLFYARKQTQAGAQSQRPQSGRPTRPIPSRFSFSAPPTEEAFASGKLSSSSPGPPVPLTLTQPAQKTTSMFTSAAPSLSSLSSEVKPQTALQEISLDDKKDLEKKALAILTQLGYEGLNPADEYAEELHVMAEVRAYFHIAYRRIIDYVPLSIDHLLLNGLSERLQGTLIEKLGLGSAKSIERCTAYLAEDANVVASRTELTGKKERLESVQKELDNFLYA